MEAGASMADRLYDFEQVAGGASQAVELPDRDDIPFAELVEHPVQLRPFAVGSGDLFPEDPTVEVGRDGCAVSLQAQTTCALPSRGHMQIADEPAFGHSDHLESHSIYVRRKDVTDVGSDNLHAS